ncbi:MAG: hypothetical protein HC866_08065 [Leptolyngbyaceae cyanobacterium RU_5_1]|nr:hypothetical protein [Leptolyngbyaceae cyanobacterium RU_5_1]
MTLENLIEALYGFLDELSRNHRNHQDKGVSVHGDSRISLWSDLQLSNP